jgi:hypothetical protein
MSGHIYEMDLVGQGLESMSAAFRQEEARPIVNFDRGPLAIGWRPFPQIERDVERPSKRTADIFVFRSRRELEMKTAERPRSEGHRMIGLDEVGRETRLGE